MKRRNQSPAIYQATFRVLDEPVRPRPELRETLPHHADMLRYDVAFHSPIDSSLVIFPLFRHKSEGTYPEVITGARWRSFGITLTAPMDDRAAFDYLATHPTGDWITYQHPEVAGRTDYGQLVPVTLNEWLKAHPKCVIAGWKTINCPTGTYFAVTG